MFKAYAAAEAGGAFEAFEYDPGELKAGEVELEVISSGICHSDLSMVNNDWGMTTYPFVGGHEVIGKIVAVGDAVEHLSVGQVAGLGWFSNACMHCQQCMSGDHNLCGSSEATIVGRHGGFADRVRGHANSVVPLPEGVDPMKAGPLFCGGITVFNPMVQFDVRPTDRVGVIGIGGLGHLALQFLSKWGCEVTAFTSSESKAEEARGLGAHHIANSRDPESFKSIAGSLDFVISTVNVSLDWPSYLETLSPKGRLHVVGAAPDVTLPVFPMILGQKSLGGSPVGSPSVIATMLDFAARHGIEPMTERYPMAEINEAFEKLRSGSPRYRLVLAA
ncbi:NADPH-dependent aldehyde reductase Ahr [Mucisphaera calidilacus]|uniref:alcohol dehydrogenase (NADP(+)) n=1 Tax=Mucisphaera calidilacus TaxID=2527982 RepID=A0A518BTV3_9BACT|nr:NAD(P)-dependent alcohol dehydrogenase [Mucisphaera calidilacus]QDU70403.1 Aldehyde reductase Ahr [Mucisphaera calidilacus]